MSTPSISVASRMSPDLAVTWEQIDPATEQAITLLTRTGGVAFFDLFKRCAKVKQPALPSMDTMGAVSIAILSMQSLEAFARQHQWGKDTFLRYVSIFCALGLMRSVRSRTQSELHFPLIPYVPPATAIHDLDQLIEHARPKLRQLATGVKTRFQLLYGNTPVLTSPSSQASCHDLYSTLLQVQEVFPRGRSTVSQRLLLARITMLLERFSQKDRETQGDLQDQRRITPGQKGDLQWPECVQKGDFQPGQGTSSGQSDTQKGDFQPEQGNRNGAHATQKGDFQPARQGTHSQQLTRKGDFQAALTSGVTQKGDFQEEPLSGVTQKGDFHRQSAAIVAQKGDFQGAAPGASLNDNVITLDNDSLEEGYDSDNDAAASTPVQEPYSPTVAAKVGRKLALFLENSPENTGGFVSKCKACTPTVIQAAVIDVLVHQAFPTIDPADDRGRPRNKAKWFHDTCKKYAMPGARIPAFIEKWLRTDLSWQDLEAYWKEIAEQLDEAGARYRRSMIAGAGSADLVRKWLRGEIEQQTLDEALQSSVLSQENPLQRAPQPLPSASSAANGTPLVTTQAVAHVEKSWMDEDEAEVLAQDIENDECVKALGVSKAVAAQEHGIWVVMVTWRGATFPMKTPQQWSTHVEAVQRSMALQHQDTREREKRYGTIQ